MLSMLKCAYPAQLLVQAFKLAQEHGLVQRVPRIRRLPERNTRQGFFEQEECEAVADHLPTYLKDFVRFAYLSGWRKSEISQLQWTDVDRKAHVIRLRPATSKTQEGRVLVLDEELWDLLERCWQEQASVPWVFHRKRGKIGDFRKAWKTACKKAGIPGKLFHDLRRTAVRNMVRAGVPERVAMAVSGHKTRSIFDRYNIVNEQDLREAMVRTRQYLNSQNIHNSCTKSKRVRE
jgi:integrase